MATANGVLLPKIRIGMTGCGLIQISATTNAIHETTLPASIPQTLMSPHSSSSVLFNVNPRSRHPTAKTSVIEPSQSIRVSFWRRVRGRWGSGMFTWIATSREEIAMRGSCKRKAERQPIVSFSKPPKGPPRPAPAPKRLAPVRILPSGKLYAYTFAIPIAPIVSRDYERIGEEDYSPWKRPRFLLECDKPHEKQAWRQTSVLTEGSCPFQ